MTAILETRHFDLYYGRRHVLKDISLAVHPNEVLAVIGPSGCGKSTLLRCFNRMNDRIPGVRTKGEVLFEGRPVQELDPVVLRRQVGMVFQRPTPFPMSIFDNVAYGPRMHGRRDPERLVEIVETSLRRAALWDEVKGKLRESALALSGGQKQRLCIARTLAVEPKVVLFDEPTSSLDPAATARIEELIEEFSASYTIVLVTHDLGQAARTSDRTAFLFDGELVEIGETRELFQRPRDPRTWRYLSGADERRAQSARLGRMRRLRRGRPSQKAGDASR